MKKVVLTGAAGRLGSYLREPLSTLTDQLVSSDIVGDLGALYTGETYIRADLTKFDEIHQLLDEADIVVYFGRYGDEAPFDTIRGPNIIGAYNVSEAAHRNGVRRVVYADSIQSAGMHSKTDFISTVVHHRPDTFYGLAKCFAEDLASFYWDKRGLEAQCLRIISCAHVTNARALGKWLSYDDLIHLVEQAISRPTTSFSISYDVSNNDRLPVDDSKVSFIGYRPGDNGEQFAGKILADAPHQDHGDPEHRFHGGPFVSVELGESGLAAMHVIDDRKKLKGSEH